MSPNTGFEEFKKYKHFLDYIFSSKEKCINKNPHFCAAVSSISRVLRARFGTKFEDSDFDKKKQEEEEEEEQRRTKHSIDGILADKGQISRRSARGSVGPKR